jgi:hypothetical protein
MLIVGRYGSEPEPNVFPLLHVEAETKSYICKRGKIRNGHATKFDLTKLI